MPLTKENKQNSSFLPATVFFLNFFHNLYIPFPIPFAYNVTQSGDW